jgi:hypothetical protein
MITIAMTLRQARGMTDIAGIGSIAGQIETHAPVPGGR